MNESGRREPGWRGAAVARLRQLRDGIERRVGAARLRSIAIGLTGGLLVAAAGVVVIGFSAKAWGDDIGGDFFGYLAAARTWLETGAFYLPRQLHGAYQIEIGDVLYPPTVLWLLVPFTVLPAVAWWAIPLGITAVVIRGWRPSVYWWPLMAAGFAFPDSPYMIVRGTPTIWLVAGVAAALRWRWPGALVLLKPSLLPFALIGIRSRGWWIAVGVLALATLPLLGLVPNWLAAVLDGQGKSGLLYSAKDLPIVSIPVFAWLGRTRLRQAP
jgi:hypothetical protein